MLFVSSALLLFFGHRVRACRATYAYVHNYVDRFSQISLDLIHASLINAFLRAHIPRSADRCTYCEGEHFHAFADDTTKELAVDILNELDWCLDQLEGMQTHRSVSNMTTNKV